uniref:Uncharacterized protein n=1 Tax=Rhizophora mucronata TaxID=61149 RepID=A0A2P2KFB8_RHIMU
MCLCRVYPFLFFFFLGLSLSVSILTKFPVPFSVIFSGTKRKERAENQMSAMQYGEQQSETKAKTEHRSAKAEKYLGEHQSPCRERERAERP